jgi:hypothetical protein
MAESTDKDISIGIIPKHKYIPELEEQVARWNRIITDLPRNDYKHTRVEIPEFKNDTERVIWEREEIKRCRNGYKGMCGKMYFYFNYCYIKKIKGGKIHPEFRVADNEWFRQIEECMRTSRGFICVKRRRAGASWKQAADALHDVSFNKYFTIGMNSKSEVDSKALFQKVKFLYDNLPGFLRVKINSDTQLYMEFAEYREDPTTKQLIKRGNESEVIVRPPVDTAFEGLMLHKWVCDEAGKLANLAQLWAYTEPCFMDELIRSGVPILFGTSGEVGKEGKGLKEMWDHAEVYDLNRFFFGGWMGILVDDYGNDRKEEAIRWIIYTRYRRKNTSAKSYNDFVQQYPLSIGEAFSQASAGGVGDIVKINSQLANLTENPPKFKRGRFALDEAGHAKFVPDPQGKAILYVEPEKYRRGLYVAGCDPADHDDAYEEASDLSMYVLKKADGGEPPIIVFEYTDRPANLVEYYEQAMLALMYYNDAKVFVEDNRYRFIGFFKENGYAYLLQTAPKSYTTLFGGKPTKPGFRKGTATTEYMEELITEYIDDYYDHIPSKDLLQECIEYGSKNTDRVVGFAAALMVLKEDKRKIRIVENNRPNYTPTFGYRRLADGRIVRVADRNGSQDNGLDKEMKGWTIKQA